MMKQLRVALLSIVGLLSTSLLLTALDAGASYRIESLAFKNDRASTETDFSGLELPMGFSLYATEKLQQDLTLDAEYSYDSILRHILTGVVTYQGNLFSFGVGPFLGFFNTDQLWPKVGVTSVFRVEWPGTVFVELWLDNSTGSQLTDTGDYLQERSNLSVGFYVPNAICSVNLFRRRFAENTGAAEVSDQISEYTFAADIFEKNVPFKIILSFGLQTLTREWDVAGVTTTHTLQSLIVGTQFDMKISDAVGITIDLDSGVYSFGQDELVGIPSPGIQGYLFRAVAGVTVDVDSILGTDR